MFTHLSTTVFMRITALVFAVSLFAFFATVQSASAQTFGSARAGSSDQSVSTTGCHASKDKSGSTICTDGRSQYSSKEQGEKAGLRVMSTPGGSAGSYLDKIKATQDKIAKLRKELEGYKTGWKNGSSSDTHGTSTKKGRGPGHDEVGDDHREDWKERGCSTPGSSATTTCTARNYGIDDVVSVIYEPLKSRGRNGSSTMSQYVVKLEDGKHRKFIAKEKVVAPYSDALTKVVRKTGYQGDLEDLFEIAVQKVGKKFALTDVKSVTSTAVDPLPGAADDEYTKYTITLNDGRVITVKGHAGRGTVDMRESNFRKAGYTGDVDALIAKATAGAVLGASTTSLDQALDEASAALDELATLLQIE
jgi:hypothetical protein